MFVIEGSIHGKWFTSEPLEKEKAYQDFKVLKEYFPQLILKGHGNVRKNN